MILKFSLLLSCLLLSAAVQCNSSLELTVYNADTGEPITGYKLMIQSVNGDNYTLLDQSPELKTIPLKPSDTYTIEINCEDYIGLSDQIITTEVSTTYQKEYFLDPIRTNCCSFEPPHVYFKVNSTEFNNPEGEEAEYLFQLLKNNPELYVCVEGYRALNEAEEISIKRAAYFKNWLIDKRIRESHLSVKDAGISDTDYIRYYCADHSEYDVESFERRVCISIIRFSKE